MNFTVLHSFYCDSDAGWEQCERMEEGLELVGVVILLSSHARTALQVMFSNSSSRSCQTGIRFLKISTKYFLEISTAWSTAESTMPLFPLGSTKAFFLGIELSLWEILFTTTLLLPVSCWSGHFSLHCMADLCLYCKSSGLWDLGLCWMCAKCICNAYKCESLSPPGKERKLRAICHCSQGC